MGETTPSVRSLRLAVSILARAACLLWLPLLANACFPNPDDLRSGGAGASTGTAATTGAAGVTGSAGRGGTTGTAGASGTTGRGGTTGTAGNASVTGAAGATAGRCVGGTTLPPAASLITDFSDAVPDTTSAGDFRFGGGTAGRVQGGTYRANNPASAKGTLSLSGGALSFSASVSAPATSGADQYPYNVAGLYMDGPACVDGTNYTGVSFSLSGNLGTCALSFAFVYADDLQPSSDPDRGLCSQSNCYPSEFSVNSSTTSVLFTATPTSNGSPVVAVDKAKLIGVEWLLKPSGTASCSASITVDNVSFISSGSCQPPGNACTVNGDCCQSGTGASMGAYCIQPGVCHAKCTSDSNCTSGFCAAVTGQTVGACTARGVGDPCTANSQCVTGSCATWCQASCSVSNSACLSQSWSTANVEGFDNWCLTTVAGDDRCFPGCNTNADCAVYGSAVSCKSFVDVLGFTHSTCSF
jgi:hypothetical protein